MTDIQPTNIANMYQDIIMKLQQHQHPMGQNPGAGAPPAVRPPGPNPVANLLAQNSGLPNSPSLLHQLQQFRDAAARRPFAGLEAKEKERESPQSSGQSSSAISSQNIVSLVKPPAGGSSSTPDTKAARRSDQKEQHKCPKCDYTTPWKSSIATHMKLKHSNERPWRCEICGKAYKLKHHLKAHMEGSHASEKPYQCKLCVFSCIDSRTLNKHMFNKHGRQTPLKAPGVMGRSPSALGSMLPMLSRNHPMQHQRDQNGAPPPQLPFNAAWGHAAAMQQRANLIRAAAMQQAQQQQQKQQPVQTPSTLEQIQHIQEQLIGNQMKQNKLEEQQGGSNTALLAHLAAQMQRAREAEMQRLQNMAAAAVNNAQINSSTGQSLNTTPDDDEIEEAKSEGAKVEELDEEKHQNTITIEPTSPHSSHRAESPARDQPIMEASTPTQNDCIKNEITATPPVSSPIKVPSENENSDTESLKLSRKRKHDQPLDYSINEALLQQRLALQQQQQQQQQLPTSRALPFPYQMPPFTRRLSNGSSDDRPVHPSLNNHMALAFQRMQSACPPDLVNHLNQMQAAGLMFPKAAQPVVTAEPTTSPTKSTIDVGTEPEKVFTCEYCQIVFPNEELFHLHMELHGKNNNQPFECAQCGKQCSNAVEFFLHFRNNECNRKVNNAPITPADTAVAGDVDENN